MIRLIYHLKGNKSLLYQEFAPSDYLSRHVECYWELQADPEELHSQFEVFSPDCTFEILFSKSPLLLKQVNQRHLIEVAAGAVFLGQKTTSKNLVAHQKVKIFGIRFKPFAFANLIEFPLYKLNDKACPIHVIFPWVQKEKNLVDDLISGEIGIKKVDAVERFLCHLLQDSFTVDQQLRAQLNYILDRKGVVKITDLFAEFGVSKVTLRKHFVNKMGLSPKKVSRIWRINYFLWLKKNLPSSNLTELSLTAGFYDQAHFIKEFRSFFGECPNRFLKNDSQLMGISQEVISKRFTNQYDPR